MISKILFVIIFIVLIDSGELFTCSTQGRFQNVYDPTCKTYYLCENTLEKLTPTLYKCPHTFDPNLNECSENYVCRKESHCVSSGYIPDLSDRTCTRYYNCFGFFGLYLPFTYSCAHGYQFDPTKKHCSATYKCEDYLLAPEEIIIPITTPIPLIDEFICTETGLFPDKTDKSCSSYFYCLPISGGKYLKNVHKCPKYFNPESKSCTDNYKCPYNQDEIDLVTQNTESVTISIKTTITTKTDLTEIGTTEAYTPTNNEIDETTNIIEATTTFHQDETTFDSIQTKPEDEITTIMTESSMINEITTQREETTVIFEDYTSTKVNTEIITDIAINTVTEIVTEKIFETTSNAIETESIPSDIKPTTNLPIDTTKAIDITKPDTIYVTTEETLTPIEVTSQSSEEFICEATGRYPDVSDEFCSQYFLCSKLHSGGFIKTAYKCPGGTYFDPKESTCSKTFQCFNINTNSTIFTTQEMVTTENVINQDTTLISTTTKKPEEFNCTSTGKFPNLIDETCTSYFLCSKRQNGTFVKTLYNCQGGSTFDPDLKRCSKEHQCSSHQLETTTTTSTTMTQWEFSCNKVGRFKNENDSRCKSYFLCSQFRNGTFVKTQYDCPNSSIFNNAKHICSDVISSRFV
ncbi:uncharacterized protein [Onthophagus taurus]|uniref:uncharacterized protein n=1 Tax=Onthophagus taurus TaxID=166361 RepID=UPI0039BE85CB